MKLLITYTIEGRYGKDDKWLCYSDEYDTIELVNKYKKWYLRDLINASKCSDFTYDGELNPQVRIVKHYSIKFKFRFNRVIK